MDEGWKLNMPILGHTYEINEWTHPLRRTTTGLLTEDGRRIEALKRISNYLGVLLTPSTSFSLFPDSTHDNRGSV